MAHSGNARVYRLGQVCARTGLSARQLRSWERLGLIAPNRTDGNQRIYTQADIETLERAVALRRAGLSLAEMRLVFRIMAGNRLGADVDGLRQVRALLTRTRRELDVADRLVDAVEQVLLRRTSSSSRPI